jgi:hypothetical protein
MSAKTIGEFISSPRSHNRHRIIRTNVRLLCPEHGMQKVVDYFKTPRGPICALECKCRRPESANRLNHAKAAA